MTSIAVALNNMDFTLRSGGAKGADTAFENGADLPEIYTVKSHDDDVDWPSAIATVNEFHPAPERLSPYVTKLMARNAFQVLGSHLDTPTKFIICWAQGSVLDLEGRISSVSGGTGQAVRIAYANKIDVFNLAIPQHLERISTGLKL